ncbi:MAG: peptide-methionine (R)-S-oxide reductase MsrB [Acidobacteria bacterium]|nr:peptide-methionine (R)-S-oxide reductase MsrB [Acidobacteriota bacterium]
MTPRVVSICVSLLVAGIVVVAFASVVTRPPERSFAKHFEAGVYVCATCRQPLFESRAKFASTTRWPSFRAAVESSVAEREDRSEGLERTEILCRQCNAHLGHVFDDGERTGDDHPDAGLRYCVLSSALEFEGEARE